jgi:hypothetical protein
LIFFFGDNDFILSHGSCRSSEPASGSHRPGARGGFISLLESHG